MELRAEDLRCNNILLVDDGKGEPYQITIKGINTINGGHVYDEDDSIHGLDCLKPIPLTEEWLLKFGWVWNKETNTFEKYPNGDARMHLSFRDVSKSYMMFNYVLKAKIADRIYYVHQLQNLYYALTKKELQVL